MEAELKSPELIQEARDPETLQLLFESIDFTMDNIVHLVTKMKLYLPTSLYLSQCHARQLNWRAIALLSEPERETLFDLIVEKERKNGDAMSKEVILHIVEHFLAAASGEVLFGKIFNLLGSFLKNRCPVALPELQLHILLSFFPHIDSFACAYPNPNYHFSSHLDYYLLSHEFSKRSLTFPYQATDLVSWVGLVSSMPIRYEFNLNKIQFCLEHGIPPFNFVTLLNGRSNSNLYPSTR